MSAKGGGGQQKQINNITQMCFLVAYISAEETKPPNVKRRHQGGAIKIHQTHPYQSARRNEHVSKMRHVTGSAGAQKRPRTGARRYAKGPTMTPQRATKRTPQGSQKDPQSSNRAPKGPAEPWKGSRSTRRAPKGFQKEPQRTLEEPQKEPQSTRRIHRAPAIQ